MRVAFLGMGIMGRPMAANLVKGGHDVVVWNRNRRSDVAGATTANTAAEAAQGREVIWMCVSDTAAVEQVLFGPDGVEPSLAPGMVVIDSSTISPFATKKFAEKVRARGADYLDAPITGSKIGAESGQLVFIVGGRAETLDKVRALFDVTGKNVLHMGDTGKGQTAKLGMNLMIALMYEGYAEALTLTAKLGLESTKFMQLIQASMVRSGVVDYKAPFVLKRDFSPNFPLRLMHKDIHLMLDAARELRVKLPGLETVDEIYEIATEEGLKDQDYAATLELLEKWAGVEVKGTSA